MPPTVVSQPCELPLHGCGVGAGVGAVVGALVGATVGLAVGAAVGEAVGAAVVAAVGAVVGDAVGLVVGAAVVVGVGAGVGIGVGAAVTGAIGAEPMYVATAVMCAAASVSEAPVLGRTVQLTTTPLPDATNVTLMICAGVTPRTAASAFWYTTLIAAVTVQIFWLGMVIVACTDAPRCVLAVAEADVTCGITIGTMPALVALVDTAGGTLEMNELRGGGGLVGWHALCSPCAAVENFPLGQNVHDAAWYRSENLPFGHLPQLVGVTTNSPGRHPGGPRQLTLSDAEKRPAGHSEQAELRAPEFWPAGHAWHTSIPTAPWNLPLGHSRHFRYMRSSVTLPTVMVVGASSRIPAFWNVAVLPSNQFSCDVSGMCLFQR